MYKAVGILIICFNKVIQDGNQVSLVHQISAIMIYENKKYRKTASNYSKHDGMQRKLPSQWDQEHPGCQWTQYNSN